jgi:predicted Rossmann fold nucleotide-binding protein DprA/Smf involved in DNA uptake
MLAVHALPESAGATPDVELSRVAEDLMNRAKTAREQGAVESSKKLLRAALNLMAEETEDEEDGPGFTTKPLSPATIKITDMLKSGWQEVQVLAETTGLSINRVHSLLARLKRGKNFALQSQAIKRYRLVPKE